MITAKECIEWLEDSFKLDTMDSPAKENAYAAMMHLKTCIGALQDIKKHQEIVMRKDFEQSTTWFLADRMLKKIGAI